MDEQRDPEIGTALLETGREADLRPDLEDVERRLRRRVRRKRLAATMVGLVGLVVVIGVILLTLGPLGSSPRPQPIAARHRTGVPEGRLLLGSLPGLLATDGERELEVGVAYSISSDGSKVVGANFMREPTGITRDPELVVVDVRTGRGTVVLRGGSRDDFGPSAWSPDGTKIAYRKTVYADDPAKVFPRQSTDTLCVLEPARGRNACFSSFKQVISFDWSPDGTRLLVAGPGRLPLWIVNVESGANSMLLPPGGTPSIRDALDRAGHGLPGQFVEPSWSPSGRYFGALASVTGGDAAYVPVVFGPDGRFVAMGRPSTESAVIGWSTVQDVLAYTTAKAPYTTTGAFLLVASTGQDRLLLSTDEVPGLIAGLVTGLAWSPSGRWLALGDAGGARGGGILILDTEGRDPPISISGVHAHSVDVVGWSR